VYITRWKEFLLQWRAIESRVPEYVNWITNVSDNKDDILLRAQVIQFKGERLLHIWRTMAQRKQALIFFKWRQYTLFYPRMCKIWGAIRKQATFLHWKTWTEAKTSRKISFMDCLHHMNAYRLRKCICHLNRIAREQLLFHAVSKIQCQESNRYQQYKIIRAFKDNATIRQFQRFQITRLIAQLLKQLQRKLRRSFYRWIRIYRQEKQFTNTIKRYCHRSRLYRLHQGILRWKLRLMQLTFLDAEEDYMNNANILIGAKMCCYIINRHFQKQIALSLHKWRICCLWKLHEKKNHQKFLLHHCFSSWKSSSHIYTYSKRHGDQFQKRRNTRLLAKNLLTWSRTIHIRKNAKRYAFQACWHWVKQQKEARRKCFKLLQHILLRHFFLRWRYDVIDIVKVGYIRAIYSIYGCSADVLNKSALVTKLRRQVLYAVMRNWSCKTWHIKRYMGLVNSIHQMKTRRNMQMILEKWKQAIHIRRQCHLSTKLQKRSQKMKALIFDKARVELNLNLRVSFIEWKCHIQLQLSRKIKLLNVVRCCRRASLSFCFSSWRSIRYSSQFHEARVNLQATILWC